MKKKPDLTKPELIIMKILWDNDAMSVREVQDMIILKKNWAYTTTKTTMDRMVKKKLLVKENFHGIHLYKAAISKVEGLFKWVLFLSDRILEVEYADVVPLFVKGESLSPKEIEELSHLLEEAEKERAND